MNGGSISQAKLGAIPHRDSLAFMQRESRGHLPIDLAMSSPLFQLLVMLCKDIGSHGVRGSFCGGLSRLANRGRWLMTRVRAGEAANCVWRPSPRAQHGPVLAHSMTELTG